MVTIKPCFFNSSIPFFVLRSFILLFDKFIIRKKGILGRLLSKVIIDSSPNWLNDKFKFVTLGINYSILYKPSLVSLFFTSFSPFTFLICFIYART